MSAHKKTGRSAIQPFHSDRTVKYCDEMTALRNYFFFLFIVTVISIIDKENANEGIKVPKDSSFFYLD